MRIKLLADYRHRIAEIAALLHAEWGDLAPWAVQADIERRFAGQLHTAQAPFTLVALADSGELLGTASVKLFELPDHPDKVHWLGEVFIPRERRGQGIGSALVRACIAQSRALGLPALYLYTPDQQALYARFGWQEIAGAVVNGEEVSIMVLGMAQATSIKAAEPNQAEVPAHGIPPGDAANWNLRLA